MALGPSGLAHHCPAGQCLLNAWNVAVRSEVLPSPSVTGTMRFQSLGFVARPCPLCEYAPLIGPRRRRVHFLCQRPNAFFQQQPRRISLAMLPAPAIGYELRAQARFRRSTPICAVLHCVKIADTFHKRWISHAERRSDHSPAGPPFLPARSAEPVSSQPILGVQ